MMPNETGKWSSMSKWIFLVIFLDIRLSNLWFRDISLPTNGDLEILFDLFLYGWKYHDDTNQYLTDPTLHNPKFLVCFHRNFDKFEC